MLEKTLTINCEDIIISIDNSSNFKDFDISDIARNISTSIQIDAEANTIRINSIDLSFTQCQVFKQFINQLK